MEKMTTGLPKEHPTTFISWFQREFLKRRSKNSGYSIRAFANYLGLPSGTVSHLLSGKRKPSVKYITKLCAKLEMSPQEHAFILNSLAKNPSYGDTSFSPQEYSLISIESFKVLSEWYHFAILELTHVKGFQYDLTWISRELGISVIEARQAIERLLKLDLLVEKRGKLLKTQSFVTNGENDFVTSSAHKQFQRHVLQRALEAIDNVAIEEKEITSMTMAIDESKLPQARKMMTKFRRDLCQFLENGNQTRVYNLGIQLYPLSKGTRK
ncbi:MAG: TIGR02147 family protein [Bdellovibrionota bacterium]